MNSIICIGSSFIQFSLQQEFYNLIMRKCSELNGLVKLIEVQKNLKYFEWRDNFLDNNLTGYPYEEIFLILEKKADSLNNLIIYLKYHFFAHSLLQRIILKFHKLKMLIINEGVLIYKEQPKMLIYPDLKILHIDYITISAASSIIENSGGNLKEILLFKYFKTENNFNEESLNFIRNIYRHCPLVKYLSLLFSPSKEHFTEFEKLLKDQLCKINDGNSIEEDKTIFDIFDVLSYIAPEGYYLL
ncbi:hypothetical protein C1645_827831 [Glomus cerebriforme]|uniref:Uncharacterized protein n=1 Tax=Glomus cerebriforme TaxID=658196 RepID=A0A397SR69_9GLOM|nr:hypothetical protein C1645_827831 [Glomus cerebriforme]